MLAAELHEVLDGAEALRGVRVHRLLRCVALALVEQQQDRAAVVVVEAEKEVGQEPDLLSLRQVLQVEHATLLEPGDSLADECAGVGLERNIGVVAAEDDDRDRRVLAIGRAL